MDKKRMIVLDCLFQTQIHLHIPFETDTIKSRIYLGKKVQIEK